MELPPFMKPDEQVLWKSGPKMSIPLAITTVVGVIMVFVGAYSRVILPTVSPDIGLMIFLSSVFVTMPSWQYFLNLGAHYYVTNHRIVIARGGRPTRELGFDNIEHVSKSEGFKFGSWHVHFIAADGSDIDGSRGGVILRWIMGFDYLWRREAERVEQLVKDRLLPMKVPRVYRCMACTFQGSSQEELLHHINRDHGGSAT